MRRITYELSKMLRTFGVVFDASDNEEVLELKRSIRLLRNGRIEFYIEQYPDGSWSAESTNIDGIATGGDDPRLISDSIKDAIMTYYEIPARYYDTVDLRSDNEPVTSQQKVHVGA